jgi:hypothetical protein
MATRIATYKIIVDTSVTNKTATNSIKATTVGTRYKDLADIVKSLVDSVRVLGASSDTPTLQRVITKDSVTRKGATFLGDSIKLSLQNSTNRILIQTPGIFEFLNGKFKTAIGYGGSGSTSYGTMQYYFGDAESYNQIIPSQTVHGSPYFDTLPNGSGRFARTIDYPDTSTIILFADTITRQIPTKKYVDSLRALGIQYIDTTTTIRTIAASNTAFASRWLNNATMALATTGILGLSDSNSINIRTNNKTWITLTPRGRETHTCFNNDTSGTSNGFLFTDTIRAGGSNVNQGFVINQINTSQGTTNTAFAIQNNGANVVTISSGGVLTTSAGATIGGTLVPTSLNITSGGGTIGRNNAAAGTAFTANQQNVAGGGAIAKFQGAGATKDSISVNGIIVASGISGGFVTPTIVDSSGGSATVSISGNDVGGTITLITTATITTASIARITFAQASASLPQTIIITPVNDAAAVLTTMRIITPASTWSTLGFALRTTGILTAGTYVLSYLIVKAP